MKKASVVLAIVLAALCGLFLLGCGSEAQEEQADSEPAQNQNASSTYSSGIHHAKVQVKGYDPFVIELNADEAPLTVTNFCKLAEEGFYNGLTFHRIVEGFCLQGGDPNGNGTGGSGKNITGEFAANGFDNPISHTRGVISMARAQDYNSASSQFFIMHADYPDLDGNYAAFGHVISGMDVVDAICASTPVMDANGSVPSDYQPVIQSISIQRY